MSQEFVVQPTHVLRHMSTGRTQVTKILRHLTRDRTHRQGVVRGGGYTLAAKPILPHNCGWRSCQSCFIHPVRLAVESRLRHTVLIAFPIPSSLMTVPGWASAMCILICIFKSSSPSCVISVQLQGQVNMCPMTSIRAVPFIIILTAPAIPAKPRGRIDAPT